MGLIRKSLNLASYGLVSGSSKKQKMAKRSVLAQEELVRLMQAQQPEQPSVPTAREEMRARTSQIKALRVEQKQAAAENRVDEVQRIASEISRLHAEAQQIARERRANRSR